jgi:hypothetical protein
MRLKTLPKKYKTGWLLELDKRTALAQVMLERYRAFTDDLGGADSLTYGQRSLVERALHLEYWLAQQERALMEGAEFDVGKWVQATNSLQGLINKLGLERQAKDVTSLKDYLHAREASA